MFAVAQQRSSGNEKAARLEDAFRLGEKQGRTAQTDVFESFEANDDVKAGCRQRQRAQIPRDEEDAREVLLAVANGAKIDVQRRQAGATGE